MNFPVTKKKIERKIFLTENNFKNILRALLRVHDDYRIYYYSLLLECQEFLPNANFRLQQHPKIMIILFKKQKKRRARDFFHSTINNSGVLIRRRSAVGFSKIYEIYLFKSPFNYRMRWIFFVANGIFWRKKWEFNFF